MSHVGRKKKKLPSLGSMTHRVVICTMRDVVDENGDLRLTREAALKQWAEIVEKSSSLFSPDGQPVVKESRDKQTHVITVRALDGIEIGSAAWVYESRERRPPRWFKVLNVGEPEDTAIGQYARFWKLSCRLYEKSDEITKPVGEAQPTTPSLSVVETLPADVKL